MLPFNFDLILLSGILVSLVAGVFALYKRRMPGSEIGGMLIIHGSIWTFMYLVQTMSQHEPRIILFYKLQFMFGQIMPSLFTTYVVTYLQIKIKSHRKMNIAMYSFPFLVSLNILLNDPLNLMWNSFHVTEHNQVVVQNGLLSDIIVYYNYFIIILLLAYFIKMLIKPQQVLRIRIGVFFSSIIIYAITFGLDYYGYSSYSYEFAPLVFNILSSSIMLLKPEEMYKRDVIPVIHNIVMDNMENPVLVIDDDDKIVYLNSKSRDVLKIDKLKFLQQDFNDVFPKFYEYVNTKDYLDSNFEHKNVFYQVKKYLVDDWQEKQIIIYVLDDVTELISYSLELEVRVEEKTEQLVHAERLAAIGKMTSMVGHDLRNPLQVIRLIGSKLESRIAGDPMSKNMIQRVNKNVLYMDKIVSDLQLLAKNREPKPKLVKLRELLEDSKASLEVPDSVEFVCGVSHDKYVYLDDSMFIRVFVNLLNNAIQAMPNGGSISVDYCQEDDFDVIVLQNSGKVISEEVLNNMFTPFYTTKAKGMGLGLSVCRQIVESHKGSISVESVEGKGTSFTIKLPCKYMQKMNTQHITSVSNTITKSRTI